MSTISLQLCIIDSYKMDIIQSRSLMDIKQQSQVQTVTQMDKQTQTLQQQNNFHLNSHTQPIHIKGWSLYAKRRGKHSQNQKEQYHQPSLITTIRNIQQFFLYYSSIKLPSQYEVDTKVMIFEEHCKPTWEAWEHSGCLLIQFKDSKQNNEQQVLDQIWEYLLFSLIGNQLSIEVIGICLNKHQKQTLIEIWLRSLQKKHQIAEGLTKMINRDLQHVLRKIKREIDFKYTEHRQSIRKHSTMKGCQTLKTPPKKPQL